ncbi:MAG: imidazole glycerol phosphate synthase subunit HisF [Christensenellales bacterium]|jgi:cyclase
MKYKRILPCLDVLNGQVVKGVRFEGMRDIASPLALARAYDEAGADELVFYDIGASVQGRGMFLEMLREIADQVRVPLTAGGGIHTADDFARALDCGAAKVSINTGAIRNPALIDEAARRFGAARVVLSADIKRVDGQYRLFTRGGREDTGIDAIEWLTSGVARGAGELVVNSIDADGVRGGFDMPLLRAVCGAVDVPVVASGGAGRIEDFIALFTELPGVDAGLAASVFHDGVVEIPSLKRALAAAGIEIRRASC